MNWQDVGNWIKNNAGSGAALVGSLLTGNVPGAIAAGVSMVSSATGTTDPDQALAAMQKDPQTLVKLKELANQNEADIRAHIARMTELELQDKQAAQRETQQTIRAGDAAEDPFVRRTRPAQSWISLIAALVYILAMSMTDRHIDEAVLIALFTLPWTYAGLREVGKGITTISTRPRATEQGKKNV